MPFKSKRQQRLFFSTMPDKAKEWAKKTDFSKLPEKVVKKKHDCDDNSCKKTLELASKFEDGVNKLPDGSGFFTGSFPLPKDHWLFSEIEDVLPITNSDPNKKQQAAARYAIRATTNNGKITDWDPDAMVINFLIAMR